MIIQPPDMMAGRKPFLLMIVLIVIMLAAYQRAR
nr:MAG TPA: hypothetical protein [Caudoviricetes sp.]